MAAPVVSQPDLEQDLKTNNEPPMEEKKTNAEPFLDKHEKNDEEPLVSKIKNMSVVNSSCICMSVNSVCTCIHLNGYFNKVIIKKVLTIIRRPPPSEPGPSTSSSGKRRKLLNSDSDETLKSLEMPEIKKVCKLTEMDSDDLDSDDLSADETNAPTNSSKTEHKEKSKSKVKTEVPQFPNQNKSSATSPTSSSSSPSVFSMSTVSTPSMSSSSSPFREDNEETNPEATPVQAALRNRSPVRSFFRLLNNAFQGRNDDTLPSLFGGYIPNDLMDDSDDNDNGDDDEDDDDDDDDDSWMDSLDSDMGITEDLDKVPNPEVLDKPPPKHTWYPLQEIVQRQYGTRTRYQSPSLFQQRYTGSLHAIQRLELMYKLTEHRGCVNALDFHPRGNLLASASDDRKVVIWDWARGRSLFSYRSGHSSNVFQSKWLHLVGSTGYVVSSARDGMIRLADLAKVCASTPTSLIAKHKRSAHKLSVMRDTPHVVLSVGEDGRVLSVDIRESCSANSKPFLVMQKGHAYSCMPLYSVASNPLDSNQFIVAGEDTQVYLFDRRFVFSRNSRALKRFCPSTVRTDVHCYITSAVYNYCGSEILASYNDEKIYLFNAADGTYRTPKPRAKGSKVTANLERPKASAFGDKAKGSQKSRTKVSPAVKRSPSPSNTAADSTTAYDLDNGSKGSTKSDTGSKGSTETDTGTKGSTKTDTGSKGSTKTATDVTKDTGSERPKSPSESATGSYAHCYSGHRNSATVKGVNFLGPRSEFVVSGSDDGYIYIWDRTTESIVNWMRGDDHGVVNVIESHPDMPVIATSGLDYNVKIWVPSREHPPTFKGLKKTILLNEKKRDLVGSIPMHSHLRWLWQGTFDSSLADDDDTLTTNRGTEDADSDGDMVIDDPRQCTSS